MEELKIQIECLEHEMQQIENKVSKYYENGRTPCANDLNAIISVLDIWQHKRFQVIALKDCLSAIVNNSDKFKIGDNITDGIYIGTIIDIANDNSYCFIVCKDGTKVKIKNENLKKL
jgi:hypothetical protein